MMKKQRVLAILLCAAMLITMVPASVFAETGGTITKEAEPAFADMPNDWSTAALQNAVKNGLISGYLENGTRLLKPQGLLTRAEMGTILSNAFKATAKADLSKVRDVPPGAWYADYMAKAVKMDGFAMDTTLRPDDYITREEVMTVLAKLFFKSCSGSTETLGKFADSADVSAWAKTFVCAMAETGMVNGTPSNKLFPKSNITRAEFAQIMDNMVKQYIDSVAGVKVVTGGSVVLRTAGTLKDIAVDGDLILADGIGAGKVVLDNVKIAGNLVARGGATVEFTGKCGDIIVWADNCTVYANSGADSYKDGRVIGENSKIVLPGGGSGGGGGGSGPEPTVLAKKATVKIESNVDIFNGRSASVDYKVDEKAYDVLVKFTQDNKGLFEEGVARGLNKAQDRGYIRPADGQIKKYSYNAVKEVFKDNTALSQAVADQIKDAAATNPEIQKVIDEVFSGNADAVTPAVVTPVINALVGQGGAVDTSGTTDVSKQQKAVLLVMEDVLKDSNKYSDEKLLSKVPDDMKNFLGKDETAQLETIKNSREDYLAQVTELLKKYPDLILPPGPKAKAAVFVGSGLFKGGLIALAGRSVEVLTFPVYVDPVQVVLDQYNDKSDRLKNKVEYTGESKAALDALLEAVDPETTLLQKAESGDNEWTDYRIRSAGVYSPANAAQHYYARINPVLAAAKEAVSKLQFKADSGVDNNDPVAVAQKVWDFIAPYYDKHGELGTEIAMTDDKGNQVAAPDSLVVKVLASIRKNADAKVSDVYKDMFGANVDLAGQIKSVVTLDFAGSNINWNHPKFDRLPEGAKDTLKEKLNGKTAKITITLDFKTN